MMLRSQIRNEIEKIVPRGAVFSVGKPDNPEHGDYSSNVALVLAKELKKNPREVAEELTPRLRLGRASSLCSRSAGAAPQLFFFFF